MNRLIYFFSVCLAVFISPMTFAENTDMVGGNKPYQCMQALQNAKELNLTEEQKTKIKSIRNKYKDSWQSDRAKMRDINRQMRDLIRTENMDQNKVDELITQRKELMAKKLKARITMKNEIYNTLNAEQKEKYKEMTEKSAQKRQQMMDKLLQSKNNNDD